jgi:hypothetical protein
MAESFLEEQLKRIREMTEQMSRVRDRAAEISNEVARAREPFRHSPLHEVRDLRTYSSHHDASRERVEGAGRVRRDTARDSTRRRR